MSFVYEFPPSQAIIDRFNWRAMPMFERGELAPYITPPIAVIVDYERDLIFAGGWGGGTVVRLENGSAPPSFT